MASEASKGTISNPYTPEEFAARYGLEYHRDEDVIAVEGDAGRYHPACAREIYGEAAIARAESGEGRPLYYDHGATVAPDWPVDREGNPLTTITYEEWYARDFTQHDNYCDSCLHPLLAIDYEDMPYRLD